jgi:hypothetical protein
MLERSNAAIWPLALLAWSMSGGRPTPDVRTPDPGVKAVFELDNHQPDYIRPGRSRIVALSACAFHRHNLFPGTTEGLEIFFFTRPITAADSIDILEHDAKGLKKNDFAAFVLFLDKDEKIGQVNLSFVAPGTTVARTVAWKPQDLAKSFSDYQFDGKRLRLKSKAAFSEVNAKQQALALSWDVDVDLPVVERAGKE